jgi:hypothetical protein
MKSIQNISIQSQQQVVENLIDLDEAMKPNGKFIEFIGDDYKKNPPGFEYPYDVQFKNSGWNQFRCSSLECDDLTTEAKLKSLRRMIISLQIHVDKQIISKIMELERKYDEIYDIQRLREKAYHLQEKSILSNLGTGKLEEKWNETQPQ